MEIASLITGPVGVNTYIVYGKNKGECIVIDPSDTELVNKKLNQLDVKPTAVLLTHGHFDHITGVAELVARAFVAFILTGLLGYFGICLAGPIAWIAAVLPLGFTYFKKIKKM